MKRLNVPRLASGIPSPNSFNQVISGLDPRELEDGFVAWARSWPIDGRYAGTGQQDRWCIRFSLG